MAPFGPYGATLLFDPFFCQQMAPGMHVD